MEQHRLRSDSMTALAKYPYLLKSALERPAVYVSPYAPGGGFTEAFLPDPDAFKTQRPRTVSFSQDFFEKCTPSLQEHVKTHVRQVSTDKAVLQQQQQQEIQKRQQELKQQAIMPPPVSLGLENHSTMQPLMVHTHGFPQPFHTHHSYDRPRAAYSDYNAYNLPPNSYPDLLEHDPGNIFPPPQQSFVPPGLQFQNPRDFQLQMQREAQLKRPGSYESFLREMQEVENVHNHRHGGQNKGGGESGSPLRQGMRAAGGEMLPMMRDQY